MFRSIVRADRTTNLGEEAVDTSWKLEQSTSEAGDNSTLVFVSDTSETYLPLNLRTIGTEGSTTTIVDRVWVDTGCLEASSKIVPHFDSARTPPQVTVELPPELPTSEIEVLLDQKPADILSQAHGRLVAQIGPSLEGNGGPTRPRRPSLIRWSCDYASGSATVGYKSIDSRRHNFQGSTANLHARFCCRREPPAISPRMTKP